MAKRQKADQRYCTPFQSSSAREVCKKGAKFDDDGGEEAACRSFEKYLVEMMVEEGSVSDLADVEEMLSCWSNLRSPEFVELVSRFYRELCKDLFSTASGDAAADDEEYASVSYESDV
ncbi:transcription repressor OFP17-like [Curcuma longa]|uniref:transcription repressor OFP17-like n=1 Tax=Curcuma longa TaxID=136217 RepID=UPI003D9F42F3